MAMEITLGMRKGETSGNKGTSGGYRADTALHPCQEQRLEHPWERARKGLGAWVALRPLEFTLKAPGSCSFLSTVFTDHTFWA